jgi:hypothetical protein
MTTTTTTTDRAAQKSTGPRTPEGKSRSRFNALKHGMTAKTLVLPDEDADVLQMRIETWIADLQPQNDVEQYLVEQAVQFSWRLDRAERAEVARLSHLIRSVPIAEANRQQEVVSALGYWLLSDRHVAGNTDLRTDLLNVLVPAQESRTDCRHLDIRDHPEAIVFRLESTAAGCRWLLDRWTELHALLDQGAAWLWDDKLKALRLLGKRPLDMDPCKWQGYIEDRDEVDDLKLEDLIEEQLDRQLDQRLAAKNPATLAVLRSIADQAIARLETLAAGHRQRAEADAAQQAALLSFDASNEGERLRRYQFSCSRSLFRSLDTLIKVRRSGLGATSAERTEGSAEAPPLAVASEPVSQNGDGDFPGQSDDPAPIISPEFSRESPSIGGFTAETTETKEDECSVFRIPCSVNPPVDDGNRPNEPTTPPVDHGDLTNEPTTPTDDRQNPRNEPTTAPGTGTFPPRLPGYRSPLITANRFLLLFMFLAAVAAGLASRLMFGIDGSATPCLAKSWVNGTATVIERSQPRALSSVPTPSPVGRVAAGWPCWGLCVASVLPGRSCGRSGESPPRSHRHSLAFGGKNNHC